MDSIIQSVVFNTHDELPAVVTPDNQHNLSTLFEKRA